MSGQHPSEWASARCPLARGRAAGGGLRPPAPSSRLARAGWELAEPFPSRGAGDSIASVPWEGLSGVFLVVSPFCFSFPAVFWVGERRLVGILGVCLSVRLPSILRGRGRWDTGVAGRGDISGASRRAGLWWLCFPTPGVSTVVSFQEFLEDTRGAKPSPELS